MFELENSRDNSIAPSKVMMGGMAGIKNSKITPAKATTNLKPGVKIDDEKKKKAFETLQQGFDIFEFLDSHSNLDQEENEFGDDENSENLSRNDSDDEEDDEESPKRGKIVQ